MYFYISQSLIYLCMNENELFPYMVIMISYLVIVNYVAMNMEVQKHFLNTDFVFFGYIFRRRLLDHMVVLL